MKALAVMMLRFKNAGRARMEGAVNFRIGKTEISGRAALINHLTVHPGVINVLTKKVATIFRGLVYSVFFRSSRFPRR